jgi:hypothetical protein
MNKSIALIIKPVWRGGYHVSYFWQFYVDGQHWMSSPIPYPSEKLARKYGVLFLMRIDGYFTFWNLQDYA